MELWDLSCSTQRSGHLKPSTPPFFFARDPLFQEGWKEQEEPGRGHENLSGTVPKTQDDISPRVEHHS